MKRYNFYVPIICLAALFVSLAGCDFSARWDLRRAEKALKVADKENAEFWAEPEYHKAQKALDEAVNYAANRQVNEARDAAQEALHWAEEAVALTLSRKADMEEERDGLKRKDL